MTTKQAEARLFTLAMLLLRYKDHSHDDYVGLSICITFQVSSMDTKTRSERQPDQVVHYRAQSRSIYDRNGVLLAENRPDFQPQIIRKN